MVDDATLVERRLTGRCLKCGGADAHTRQHGDALCRHCTFNELVPGHVLSADIEHRYGIVIAWINA